MYLGDPREQSIDVGKGIIWEADNRVEQSYKLGAMNVDTCDLPASIYSKNIYEITTGVTSGATYGAVYYGMVNQQTYTSTSGSVLTIPYIKTNGTKINKLVSGNNQMLYTISGTGIYDLDNLDESEVEQARIENGYAFFVACDSDYTIYFTDTLGLVDNVWKFNGTTFKMDNETYKMYVREDVNHSQNNIYDSKKFDNWEPITIKYNIVL